MSALRAIHQFVPWLEPGATGTHTVEVQRLLRDMGIESEIFTEKAVGPYESLGKRHTEYAGMGAKERKGDVVIYQMGIGSVVGDYLLQRSEPLALNYHNITPSEFFDAWEPGLGHGSAWGRKQLPELARRCDLGIAVSRFNEMDLQATGFRKTAVAPILIDLAELERQPDPAVEETLRAAKQAGGTDWLFVGRVAPNKAQHDIIKAFAAYRRHLDPKARLHFVGGSASPAYSEVLEDFADALGVKTAVDFAGPVSDAAKASYYNTADVFVCLSDHEGFCVPLLEAWHHDLPVVAFRAAAIPETVGDAALLLPTKSPTTVAMAANRIVTDKVVRDGLIAAGRARLATFSLPAARARFKEIVEHDLVPLARS